MTYTQSEPVDRSRTGTASEAANLAFQKFLSPALVWKWRLQNFWIESVDSNNDGSYTFLFRPCNRMMIKLLDTMKVKRTFAVTAMTSQRLMFQAGIVTAGIKLKKPRKNGEVIVRRQTLECKRPITYDADGCLPMHVEFQHLKDGGKYTLFEVCASLGANNEHRGTTQMLYCAPKLSGFSYMPSIPS